MAIGTTTTAVALSQSGHNNGQVCIASDGTVCVLWCDGTNQKFSYASSPYTSWTTTTLTSGVQYTLAALIRANDDIDVATALTGNTMAYYPLTKSGATWTVGTTSQISATNTGGTGRPMILSIDPQGRYWATSDDSGFVTAKNFFSVANSPQTAGWTASLSATMGSNTRSPSAAQIGNYLVVVYWVSGVIHNYQRLDTSVSSLGSWSTAASIGTWTATIDNTRSISLAGNNQGQGMLVCNTQSGLRAKLYTAATDTWGAEVTLSSSNSDGRPNVVAVGADFYVVYPLFAAANSFSIVYKRWTASTATWDTSPTTLVASGANNTNPVAGVGNGLLGVAYEIGTATPWTIAFVTALLPVLLVDTFAGTSTLAGPLSASVILTNSLDGVGTFSGTASFTVPFSKTLAGVGTLAGTLSTPGVVALSMSVNGAGVLAGTPQLATQLATTATGVGTLSGTLIASPPVALSINVNGAGTLSGTLSVGHTYYVSTTGSDGAAGTLAAPFATINHADTVVVPGDTVRVLPGTYIVGTVIQTLTSGTAAAHIQYISDTPHAAIIKCTSATATVIWWQQASYVDIIGFEVYATSAAIACSNGISASNGTNSNCSVQNCRVHDIKYVSCTSNGGAGINMSTPPFTGTGLSAINNRVWNCGPAGCIYFHGIYMGAQGGGVLNNICYGNSGTGIHLNHAAGSMPVANNLCFNNGSSGLSTAGMHLQVTGTDGQANLHDVTCINNIAFNNLGVGGGIWSNSGDLGNATDLYNNNCCFGNETAQLNIAGGFGTLANNISADPLFIDYQADGSGNYHLQATSPCIDAGTATGAPGYDYDGRTRPQGSFYDIGPYEFLAGVLVLYGSNVAATLATAGKCAIQTDGVEVAAVTTAPASGSGYVECFALGGVSTVNASLPAPSSKGWLLDSAVLEGQRLTAGNWTASVAVSNASGGGLVNSYTIRFWQHSSGGTYAAIGSLVLSASQVISTLRVVKAFLAAAMPQTDFAVGDKLYIDFFINANGWASDLLSVYVSSSGSAGVAGDMEVDTAGYTPSGASGVVTSYIPRALSALLAMSSTALSATVSGTGTFSAAFQLACTVAGVSQLTPQLSANATLPAGQLAASGSVSGTFSLSTSLSGVCNGLAALTGSMLVRCALAGTSAGSSVVSAAFQTTTQLATTVVGSALVTPAPTYAYTLPGLVFAGASSFTSPLSASTALLSTLVGVGVVSGSLQANAGVVLSVTCAGVGTLSGAIAAVETLSGSPFAGTSALMAALSATFTLSGGAFAGIGALSTGVMQLSTALVPGAPGSGIGTLSASLSAALPLASGTCAGSGVLAGTFSLKTFLSGTLSGVVTSTGALAAATSLSGTSLASVGTLSGATSTATSLADTLPGTSTLTGTFALATTLAANMAGIGQLAGSISGGGALAVVGAGVGTMMSSLSVALSMSGTTVGGTSTLTGTLTAKGALTSTFVGVGSMTGAPSLGALWSATLAGTGTLNGTSVLATYLLVLVPGASNLGATVTRTAMMTVVYTGNTQLSAALILGGGQLSMCLLAGHGTLAAVFSYPGKSATATWKTRDHSATWQTRDLAAIWKTRDLEDTWREER